MTSFSFTLPMSHHLILSGNPILSMGTFPNPFVQDTVKAMYGGVEYEYIFSSPRVFCQAQDLTSKILQGSATEDDLRRQFPDWHAAGARYCALERREIMEDYQMDLDRLRARGFDPAEWSIVDVDDLAESLDTDIHNEINRAFEMEDYAYEAIFQPRLLETFSAPFIAAGMNRDDIFNLHEIDPNEYISDLIVRTATVGVYAKMLGWTIRPIDVPPDMPDHIEKNVYPF